MKATAKKPPAAALNSGEEEQLRQVARRLRGELRVAIKALPVPIDGPSALGELLGLDRATAHRLLQLARGTGGEFRWLQRGPGVQAIRQFAEACRTQQVDAGIVESVQAANHRYEEVIVELAGSKSKLMRRLEATEQQSSTEDRDTESVSSERLRAQLFENAASLIGRQMDVRADMLIFKPNDSDQDWVDYAWIRGVIGHRARPNTPPLALGYLVVAHQDHGNGSSPRTERFGDPLAPGERRTSILEAFSTTPSPLIVSRGKGDRVMQVIDPNAVANGEAVDVVAAHRHASSNRHPRFDDPPVFQFNAMIREPTRSLLWDIYMHRDVLVGAIPDLSLYLWSPALGNTLDDHWFDRLPIRTPLQVLGQGTDRAASPIYDRHEELTKTVFSELGWPADAFVGFRCAVPYPMFGGSYSITFEYGQLD